MLVTITTPALYERSLSPLCIGAVGRLNDAPFSRIGLVTFLILQAENRASNLLPLIPHDRSIGIK